MIGRAAAVLSVILILDAAGVGGATQDLTEQQKRGKQLYLTGESAAGRKITALLGADEVEVAASVVPCGSCHARDGSGKAEGGLKPANIQWDALLHPVTTGDRARVAYTRPLLKRAISMGLDSSSHKLQTTMPRYRMAIEDMDDLLAYLEKLGSDYDPGLGDDAVKIGAVLPAGASEEKAVRDTLSAYFARINEGGGIFGRRIDARFTTTSGSPEERAAALDKYIEAEQPFAIAAAWISGADEAMSAVAEKHGEPTIAAFSTTGSARERWVFRLLAGVPEQSLALVTAAAGDLGGKPRVSVVGDESAKPVRETLTAAGFNVVDHLVDREPQLLLFLGAPSKLESTLAEAAAMSKPPYVLIPAAHSSGDLTAAPPALDRRILVALPSAPSDVTEEGAAELRALGVPPAHATSCRMALASAKLLVEALRRPGRNIDREIVTGALETFYKVPTGLTPPISWGPNRHTGSGGVLIAAIDLQAKRWLDRGWWSSER